MSPAGKSLTIAAMIVALVLMIILDSSTDARSSCHTPKRISDYNYDYPQYNAYQTNGSISEEMKKICKMDGEIGPCLSLSFAFGYDYCKGECVQFIYGGCGGNKNNFGTLEECRSECGNMPKKPDSEKCNQTMPVTNVPGPSDQYNDYQLNTHKISQTITS